MKGNYRLTVHLDNVKRSSATTCKKTKNAKGKMVNETKSVLRNTMSWYFNTVEDCEKKLSEIRGSSEYKIKKGTNVNKKHKFANKNLDKGQDIYLYGVIVGKATKQIKKGDVVFSHFKGTIPCISIVKDKAIEKTPRTREFPKSLK